MLRFASFLLALLFAFPVFAESAEDARKELSSTLNAIKESDKRQKELAEKTLKLQDELKALQEQMVRMGRDTSVEEEDLTSNEERLALLEQQKKVKAQDLADRQADLSSMISAMVKLKQLPPEAVIAMPGKLDETLETARALGIITHAIEDESQSLKLQLKELDALEDKIRHSRETIATRQQVLSIKQSDLAAKMKERNELIDKIGGQEKEERAHIAELTARSKNLQDLLDSLQRSEFGWTVRRQDKAEAVKRHDKATGHHLRSFEDARGNIRLPATGKIVSHYGNPDIGETFSKGIVIETRQEADVVAPFDGEVVYAGEFRDYGRIVIIRHTDDYHTLLSGMDAIECRPGQYLIEGEPIGTMGGVGETKLYMELREDGRPVDPTDWVKG